MIYKAKFKNKKCYVLENDVIKLIILPGIGGKIVSIFYKPLQYEILSQHPMKYKKPSFGRPFYWYDGTGHDEMFPTIDKCFYTLPNGKKKIMTDHGEIWTQKWNSKIIDDTIINTVKGVKFRYTFERSISLDNNGIIMKYKIRNHYNFPFYGLYSLHSLIQADSKTELILKNVSEVINVHNSKYLGSKGEIHTFPITTDSYGDKYDLSKVCPYDHCKTEKFFVNHPLKSGVAGLIVNNGNTVLKMEFPSDKLPYLGVWINEGEFKKGYMVALEPSNGFYDSVENALQNKSLEPLQPKGELIFTIRFKIFKNDKINIDNEF